MPARNAMVVMHLKPSFLSMCYRDFIRATCTSIRSAGFVPLIATTLMVEKFFSVENRRRAARNIMKKCIWSLLLVCCGGCSDAVKI